MNYVTTFLATLYMKSHQQYIPPYFEKIKLHTTIQTMLKQGYSHPPPLPKKINKKIHIIFLYHRPLPFFASQHKTRWIMSMDNVDLNICFLGTSHSIVTLDISLPTVNQSGPGMNSTINHRFYRALGRLHGPWCEQLLNKDVN